MGCISWYPFWCDYVVSLRSIDSLGACFHFLDTAAEKYQKSPIGYSAAFVSLLTHKSTPFEDDRATFRLFFTEVENITRPSEPGNLTMVEAAALRGESRAVANKPGSTPMFSSGDAGALRRLTEMYLHHSLPMDSFPSALALGARAGKASHSANLSLP